MTNKQTGGPAFPAQFYDERATGMDLRQYAAIKLRVPQSGDDWLDDMIREARRMDFAAMALQGLLVDAGWDMGYISKLSYEMADAMLKAREQ